MTVPFQVKQLRNATESQMHEIVDFFTNAFHGSISMKAFVGGDNISLLRDMEMASLRASLLEGLVYIVTIGEGADEEIVSSGFWFSGNTILFGSKEQRALGYSAIFEKLDDDTKFWTTQTYPSKMKELGESQLTKEEREKRWWCYKLATHPKHQGKGYATAIVDTMFEKAKAEGAFIGLSTTDKRNVDKYLSMGFKSRGEGVYMPAPTGDFWMYVMTKGSLA